MDKLDAKKKQLQQRINKIQEAEAKIKFQEKKQRISKFIKIGELVENSELSHLSLEQLYGAFLSLKEEEKQKLSIWEKKGAAALHKNEISEGEKFALSVKFPTEPKVEIKQKLKSLGLKWNEYRQEWEGLAHKETVEKLVAPHQGTIHELQNK